LQTDVCTQTNHPRHRLTSLFCTSIHCSPSKSLSAIDNEKNRTSISDTVPHPNLQLWWCHKPPLTSYTLECIWGEPAALGWSRLDQKKVRTHVFVYENAWKYY
jgi:hypothetical protein